jgi:hypothetical protein
MDEQLLLNCLIVVEKQTADQQTIFIMIFWREISYFKLNSPGLDISHLVAISGTSSKANKTYSLEMGN